MKRLVLFLVLLVIGVQLAEPASAGRTVVRKGPRRTAVVHKGPHRTTVVVHKSFPIHRHHPAVVVRPARTVVRVHPTVYLAPIVWAPVVVAARHDVLVWEDGETLGKDEEWVDFTLVANSRGEKLHLQIARGEARLDFAEVVFENGEVQVVDFSNKPKGPGLYSLLDFRDGRIVDHVRVVARAETGEARIVLRMEK